MNAKIERKERSHATILASAARLLRERGIAGARVADVMDAAGLTAGGFYAHFPSKEALVDEVIRLTAKEMRAHLFHRLEEKPESARAEVVLKRYLSAKHRDERAGGCPLPAIAGEVATRESSHRDVVAAQISQMAEGLAAVLPVRGARATRTALGLVALMVGGLTLARALEGTSLSDDVLKACRDLGKRIIDGEKPEVPNEERQLHIRDELR